MNPVAGPASCRSLRFMPFLLALLLLPRPALAIPNPFTLVFLASLAWQLVVATTLFVPLWAASASAWFQSLAPGFRTALATALGLSLLLVLHIRVPDAPGLATPPGPLRERYADRCDPLGDDASLMGLEPGDVLIDPRLPAQFAQYHVAGACNLDPARLRDDPAFRRAIESTARRVVLIAEFRLTLAALYNHILAAGHRGDRWFVLDAGAMFFRLEHGASPPPQRVDTPIEDPSRFLQDNTTTSYARFGERLAVGRCYRLDAPNRFGQVLTFRSGPQYAAGWPLSILGAHPAWRERRQAFLATSEARGATWIEVRDSSERPHTPHETVSGNPPLVASGRVGATIDDLDRLAGGRIRSALFLCDNAMTCPAAEALARELLDRGTPVLGYVTAKSLFHRQFRFLLNRPPTTDWFPGAHWALLVAAIFAAVAARSEASRRISRHPAASGTRWRDAPREGASRLLGALGPAAAGWGMVAIAAGLPGASLGWGGLYVLDAGRAGAPTLSLLPATADLLVAAGILAFRPRGRATLLQVGYWTVGSLGFAAFVLLQVGAGLTVFEAAGLVAVVGAPAVAARVRHASGALPARLPAGTLRVPWRVVPLANAAGAPDAGQKARWLAIASGSVPTVPAAFVLRTTIRAFGDGTGRNTSRVARAVRALGPGPRIVRSSAPGEDRAGAALAGRYDSVHDVTPGDEGVAVARVLASYAREGIPADAPVAVIIQNQVAARLAGVATRETTAIGGGILVEAAFEDTAAVTSGRGAPVLWGRIGAFSRQWVGGTLGRDAPDAAAFVDVFAVLGRRFGHPLSIEWAFDGRRLLLLQVRPASPEGAEASPKAPGEGFTALFLLLSRRRFRGEEVVLDGIPLAELQYGTTPATTELAGALYREGGRALAVGGWPHRRLALAGPDPAVVSLDGGLYLNRVPRHPATDLLVRPFASWLRLGWRLWPGRPLGRLDAAIRETHALLLDAAGRHESPAADVPEAWARCRRTRDLVAGRVARDFLDAGLLQGTIGRAPDAALPADPVLAAAGRGPEAVRALAGTLPYRGLREWALEQPRLGELDADRPAMTRAFAARDACFAAANASATRAGTLLALARDNLSFGVALLRLDLVALGNRFGLPEGTVFRYRWEDLTAAVTTGDLPPPTVVPTAPDPRLPPRFTLARLEAWAAGDRDLAPDASAGFWVSGTGPVTGRVVPFDGALTASDDRPIRVVRHPEVRDVVNVPDDVVVVALAGNRLSHAAQVLRDRGIPGLFGADAFQDRLVSGRRVRLEADGRIVPCDEATAREPPVPGK